MWDVIPCTYSLPSLCVTNEITPVLRPCDLSKPSPNQGICVWHIKLIFDSSAFYNYRALQIIIARHTTIIARQSLSCPNSTSTRRFYVFILFPKCNLMKIFRAINTSLDNNLSTEPPSLTIMFSISSFKSFIAIFC